MPLQMLWPHRLGGLTRRRPIKTHRFAPAPLEVIDANGVRARGQIQG